MAGGAEHPDAILAVPTGFLINLPKLSFIPCHQNGDRHRAFSCVTDELVEVAFRYDGFVFVID